MNSAVEGRAGIAAAVIVHDGQVLLVRRRVAEGNLRWQFPAGEIEPGESPAGAAVREASEEVGLVVQPGAVLGERVHPATGRRMHYVQCSVIAGQATVLDPDELDGVAWCGRAALAELIPDGIFPPVQSFLEVAFEATDR